MTGQRVQPDWDDIDNDVRCHGLSANANETVDIDDVRGHGFSENANETVDVDDDVRGHGFNLSNANETVDVDVDTEGHSSRVRLGADAEAPEGDDTEGHWRVLRRADTEATEGDDTEGHAYGRWSDRNLKVDVHPVEHDDDTEGHAYAKWSDRNLKEDVHPVEHEHVHEYVEDVEGHRICTRCSDQNIKVDVHPVEHDDDVEGHRTSYWSLLQKVSDSVSLAGGGWPLNRRGREVSAAVTGGEVREVPSSLPPSDTVTVWVLRRIVGPLRRRLWKVDPLPPPLTGPQIMERLAVLPVSHWTYESEPGVRHLGPMAQDFAAAFGLGRTNRIINPLDEAWVAFTAIQALHRRVVALEAEVARLQAAAEQTVSAGRSDSGTGN